MTEQELIAKINKGAELLKKASEEIVSLQGKLKAVETKQAAAVEAGKVAVDNLIRLGQIAPQQKEAAIANLSDPVKVAEQLASVTEQFASVPSIGSADVNAKSASAEVDPVRDADERYKNRFRS